MDFSHANIMPKIPPWTHSYCCSDAVVHSKKLKIWTIVNFKNLKFTHICLHACQLTSPPAIRPSHATCIVQEFLHNKGNHIGFTKLLFWWTFIHHFLISFIMYLRNFYFQIAYGKVRNLQIDVYYTHFCNWGTLFLYYSITLKIAFYSELQIGITLPFLTACFRKNFVQLPINSRRLYYAGTDLHALNLFVYIRICTTLRI